MKREFQGERLLSLVAEAHVTTGDLGAAADALSAQFCLCTRRFLPGVVSDERLA